MNWYKKAQLKKEAGWGKSFLGLTIPAIIALIGGTAFEISKAMDERPQELAQQIQQVQQVEQVQPASEPNIVPEVEEPNIVPEVTEPNEPDGINIDLDKIWFMESTRGTNPNMDKSEAGARGHFQFMEKTWNGLVKRMGKNWDWYNGSMDYDKSSAVAQYYLNERIPEMLNAYNIPDTVETRLGAYDWGIGALRTVWKKYGEDWVKYAPQETKEYIEKYG